jgi:hypothetical protein
MIPGKLNKLLQTFNCQWGERTEIALNVRTDDGMTNGAGNVESNR